MSSLCFHQLIYRRQGILGTSLTFLYAGLSNFSTSIQKCLFLIFLERVRGRQNHDPFLFSFYPVLHSSKLCYFEESGVGRMCVMRRILFAVRNAELHSSMKEEHTGKTVGKAYVFLSDGVTQLVTSRGLERLLDISKKEKDKYLSAMIYKHSFQSFFSFFIHSLNFVKENRNTCTFGGQCVQNCFPVII